MQQCEHHQRCIAGHMASREFLQQEHHARIRRIFNQITTNGTRRFTGSALPHTSGLGSVDLYSYKAQGYLRSFEPASVYYSDGAMGDNEHAGRDGLLAAVVSYHDGLSWQNISSSPEQYTGKSIDAETERLHLAFHLAYDQSRFSTYSPLHSSSIANIVIFKDATIIQEDCCMSLKEAQQADRKVLGEYMGRVKAEKLGTEVTGGKQAVGKARPLVHLWSRSKKSEKPRDYRVAYKRALGIHP